MSIDIHKTHMIVIKTSLVKLSLQLPSTVQLGGCLAADRILDLRCA